MAARGRGSACNGAAVLGAAAAVVIVGFLVMSAAPLAEAARYTVGDSGGWRCYAEGWAKGKTFRAGDVLGNMPAAARSASVLICVLVWSISIDQLMYACMWHCGWPAEFKYNAVVHDVAAVDLAAYRSCTVPKGVRKMRSGRDKVTLRKGTHYFICTEPGHCKAGMKLAVRAI